MQDEISSAANPSLQLQLEQHGGLGGLILGGSRNTAAPPPPQPPAAGKGAKEPSPRANPAVNRRESTLPFFHACTRRRRQVLIIRYFFSPFRAVQDFLLGFVLEIDHKYDQSEAGP
jgi:hypothetical protein